LAPADVPGGEAPGRVAPSSAIFLDRDGLLNELVFYADTGEWESPRVVADLRLRPGAVEFVAGLKALGLPLFLVSNQPSAAKGKTSLEDLGRVHERLVLGLPAGAFREAFYCHHHPEAVVPELRGPCPCRKPSPHFLRTAADQHDLDLARCWMVGDQDMDIACGRAAGCRTLLVPNPDSATKRGRETPDQVCDDLAQALRLIAGHL
jgi:D-glycero-D-manno-heptose 1,7-bisphosphate phosphatase